MTINIYHSNCYNIFVWVNVKNLENLENLVVDKSG